MQRSYTAQLTPIAGPTSANEETTSRGGGPGEFRQRFGVEQDGVDEVKLPVRADGGAVVVHFALGAVAFPAGEDRQARVAAAEVGVFFGGFHAVGTGRDEKKGGEGQRQ